MFYAKDLIALFNENFRFAYGVKLEGGHAEPLYLPANCPCLTIEAAAYHRVFFRADYFASALHEVAHWCIAGVERREKLDFGYWYTPEGRNPDDQRRFENAEVKPQALEYLFSLAATYPFRVSLDNFDLPDPLVAEKHFFSRVVKQAQYYINKGLPDRANTFRQSLLDFYGGLNYIPKKHQRYGEILCH